jgi:hypothetical protein
MNIGFKKGRSAHDRYIRTSGGTTECGKWRRHPERVPHVAHAVPPTNAPAVPPTTVDPNASTLTGWGTKISALSFLPTR